MNNQDLKNEIILLVSELNKADKLLINTNNKIASLEKDLILAKIKINEANESKENYFIEVCKLTEQNSKLLEKLSSKILDYAEND